MRFPFLLAPILIALAPLSIAADKHEHHQHEHSLEAHVHGLATLNIALEGQHLELLLDSPAMNIVGFEYQPSSAADKKTVVDAERTLKNEQELFKLSQDAQCSFSAVTIDNDLSEHAEEHGHTTHGHDQDEHQHSNIQVSYQFNCAQPNKLTGIDLAGFFKAFPHTEKINVQLVTAETQQGAELSTSNTLLNW